MVNGNGVGLLPLPRRNLGREKVLFFLQTKNISGGARTHSIYTFFPTN
jgi:hypothetical protein